MSLIIDSYLHLKQTQMLLQDIKSTPKKLLPPLFRHGIGYQL
jgi:hypothetical protein